MWSARQTNLRPSDACRNYNSRGPDDFHRAGLECVFFFYDFVSVRYPRGTASFTRFEKQIFSRSGGRGEIFSAIVSVAIARRVREVRRGGRRVERRGHSLPFHPSTHPGWSSCRGTVAYLGGGGAEGGPK